MNKPTHRLGHTLDCIITEQNSNLIDNIQVYSPWISDHCLVAFNLSIQIPSLCYKSVTTRNWKSLNLDQLNSDITDADFGNSSNSVSECVPNFDHMLHKLIDIHAPARNKTILLRPRSPWFTHELSMEKREKRRLERRYRNPGKTEDELRFKEQSARYCQLLSITRETFYNSKIVENAGDQKALFSVVNKLLHRTGETQLPAHDNLTDLTNRFADFFINKIRNIRCELGDARPYRESEISTAVPCKLTAFSPVTTSDIQSLINKSNNKSCSLDPIPTWLLKNCLPSLLPIVTNIVNQSLESIMPSSYKEAVLTPILKKPDMDPESLKNYRPVSNLPYVSKLIEKVVSKQITSYVHTNNLEEAMQSAYRANHSTETALCRLHNDIVSSLNRNERVLLVSLDLSAAFDTIDHQILLARLKHRFGITDRCLQWIRSYLVGRKLRVAINGSLSNSKDLDFGVPQGSVLGPKLFTMYLAPLGDIARGLDINFHAYADDCQLYIAFSKENVNMIKYKMENLLVEIKKWMSSNMLKLNDDKTEILTVQGPRCNPVDLQSLTIGDEEVDMNKYIRLLGVDFDDNFSFKQHVSAVARKCFYTLKNMFKIRRCLDESSAKTIVHTMITSHLDYCNVILCGLPDSTLKHLTRIKRMSACFVSQRAKFDHITPTMKQLHWLPIRYRIHYKVLLLTYKSMNGLAPPYLEELIKKRPMKRTRADKNNDLSVPKFKKTFGGRSFAYMGATLWNSLPRELKHCTNLNQFKKHLKTYLFTKAYDL